MKRSKLLLLMALTFWTADSDAVQQNRDRDGLTPLHLASGRGDMSEALRLVKKGGDLFALGMTARPQLIWQRQLEIRKL